MMIKVFLTILLWSFISRGCWGCTTDDIKVIQGLSGRQVQGKPEWTVYVYNGCKCPAEAIMLFCQDFQTVEPIDPINLIQDHEGRCLINQSRPLPINGYVKFAYAWDHRFPLPVIQMKPVGC